MRISIGLVLLAGCLAQTPASAQSAPATSALRKEIEQLNRGMETALKSGDLLGAARFYADDAVVRTSRSVVAQGRKGIDAYFTSIVSPKDWKLEVREVGGPRDQPYQVGRSTLIHGTKPDTSVVDFLVIWKRQKDGKLRIMLDYYHTATR